MRNVIFSIRMMLVSLCFSLSVAAASQSTTLISLHEFVQNPIISDVKISPDGKSIAALHNVNDHIMVLVKDISAPDAATRIINVYNHDVRWIDWANNQQIIAGTLVEEGMWGDAYLLALIDKNKGDMRYLLEHLQFGNVIDTLPNDPENVLVEVFSGSPYPDVFKVSIGSKKHYERIEPSRFNINHWITDAGGNARIGLGRLPRKLIIDAKGADGRWDTIRQVDFLEDPVFYPLVINRSNIAYVLSRHESDTAALYEYDLNARAFGKRLLENEMVDIDGLYYSRQNDALGYAVYTVDQPEPYFFDDEQFKEYSSINRALPKTSNWITSRSKDEKRVIVSATGDNCPTSYYLYDREKSSLEFLGSEFPDLEQTTFPSTTAIQYKARDGMTIYGFLTIPIAHEGTPLPMVVLVHGGPRSRVQRKFDRWVQFLANRGYIVFQPNFRGSTGYGETYERSGYQQWGRDMQNDIIDGVEQLAAQDLVDADRICIMGASYGGYAALMGVARNSDIFRCAVSFAGISDLNALMIEEGFSTLNRALIDDDSGARKENSPITHAASITSPVLLAHGTKDTVVNYRHSKKMYKALKKMKKNVTFIELKGETHNLEDVKNRETFFKAMEAFLDNHMR